MQTCRYRHAPLTAQLHCNKEKKTLVETTQVVVGPVAVGTNQSLVNQSSNNRTVVTGMSSETIWNRNLMD